MNILIVFLSKTVFYFKFLLKRIVFLFIKIKPQFFIHRNVVFFSQWESKNLVDKFLKNEAEVQKDPLWKQSGADTKKDYLHWSFNGCGMACLKMVLEKVNNKTFPLVVLGKKCLKYKGYKINKKAYDEDDYLHSLPGLYYKPFVEFVEQEFNLSCKSISVLAFKELIYYLSKKNFIIVSVSPFIRDLKDKRIKKGRHLILVLGYDLRRKKIFFHNPSGLPNYSQEYVGISFSQFKTYFNYRGIIIKN